MTLRLGDIFFIVILAAIAGFGGSLVHARYFVREPFEHKVIVFDTGGYTVRRMVAKHQSSGEVDASSSLRDVAAITHNLAAQGFVVLDKQAVLSAPEDYYLTDQQANLLTELTE